MDFSSKSSVCDLQPGAGVLQESKDLARPCMSLNSDNGRSHRYAVSEVSEADDNDDVDGTDDEIIDIVGDHSQNSLQRNY